MKTFKYKGWLCEWNATEGIFELYTPSELEQPRGFRYAESEAQSVDEAKEFINHY